MAELIKQLWVILKKELIHCYRDPHVLIYGVLFPMILYPVSAIGLVEFAIWQEGKKERETIRVALPKESRLLPEKLASAIRQSPRVSIIESPDPAADIKSGIVDLSIVAGEKPDLIEVVTNSQKERSKAARALVKEKIDTARREARETQLKTLGLNAASLRIFTVETRDAVVATAGKKDGKKLQTDHAFSVVLRYGFAFVLCVLVLSVPAGAAYPAICVFTEEREKKTLESTLVLPVPTELLITGKFLAVTVVALASGFLNFISMMFVTILAASQMKMIKVGGLAQLKEVFSLEMILSLFTATVLFAALVSALFALLCACTRSFKEAQNLLTVPLLIISPIPIAGLMPGIMLNQTLALVPVLNLVLWVKATVRGDAHAGMIVMIVLESLAIIAVLLGMLTSLIKTEGFVLGESVRPGAFREKGSAT